MTAYRFRIKYESDPTALWRDIVIGADRTLEEFQSTINRSVGLNQAHLWFFGTDQDYWNSDIQYKQQEEMEMPTAFPGDEEEHSANETTVGELVARLDLVEGDRICYLFDYGDEWRFYAILKEVSDDPADTEPTVTNEKGGTVDQYAPRGERL